MARARHPGKNGSDTIQRHRWNFIFFGQTKTGIQDLLTTHIPISVVSYTESFAWVRQGKHCAKPFLITEACVSAVPRPCVPVSPSPAQHFCYSMMAWVTEAQIEPAFLLQLLLLFLLNLQSWNPFYCQPEEAALPRRAGHPSDYVVLSFPVARQIQSAPSRGRRRMVRPGVWGSGCSLQRKERRERRRTRSPRCTAATAAGRCSSHWAISPNTRLINASWQVNNVQPTEPPLHSATQLFSHSRSHSASTRENAMLRVLVHCTEGSATPHFQFLWWPSNSTDAQTDISMFHPSLCKCDIETDLRVSLIDHSRLQSVYL